LLGWPELICTARRGSDVKLLALVAHVFWERCIRRGVLWGRDRIVSVVGCGERKRAAVAALGFDGVIALQGHAEKLEPQPQVVVAFGFLITN
jgi:hypothetical protein